MSPTVVRLSRRKPALALVIGVGCIVPLAHPVTAGSASPLTPAAESDRAPGDVAERERRPAQPADSAAGSDTCRMSQGDRLDVFRAASGHVTGIRGVLCKVSKWRSARAGRA